MKMKIKTTVNYVHIRKSVLALIIHHKSPLQIIRNVFIEDVLHYYTVDNSFVLIV